MVCRDYLLSELHPLEAQLRLVRGQVRLSEVQGCQ